MRTVMNPEYPQHRAHSHVVLQLLGIVNGRLPVEGMNAREIQGVKVWVRPLYPRTLDEPRHKRSNHRVRCQCPECGVELSLGRLFQHKCKPFTADDVPDTLLTPDTYVHVPHFDTNRDRED